MTITTNAFFVADCFCKCLTKRNANIFYCMVCINMQITFSLHLNIHHAMTRDLIQHVIKETQTRVKLRNASTVQINVYGNLCFQGISSNCCATHNLYTLLYF
ncbi:hypothetical protein GALL_129690 [mine drainage metagenome]|uniref:Uncharacterized protein n=1 Tax=mine drainage metagenome TaxID=410659 RepID=A0A1J5S964_9ZZZZ